MMFNHPWVPFIPKAGLKIRMDFHGFSNAFNYVKRLLESVSVGSETSAPSLIMNQSWERYGHPEELTIQDKETRPQECWLIFLCEAGHMSQIHWMLYRFPVYLLFASSWDLQTLRGYMVYILKTSCSKITSEQIRPRFPKFKAIFHSIGLRGKFARKIGEPHISW